ncbi:hypothetical protein PWG71_04520 [Nocardiopsis sp. N85]|uniref:hypothetical protein n=1 Tax=Nocardiopsis sp. N85 TaxID=3029400 RepID=UPI00237F4113|nr:hypothetical protein [Nocardiopsis sp. N85]MDE3720642.1 hypothetical protein [Nocardiopsis sp. N85]
MFRIAISRLADDGPRIVPEHRGTVLSVDEAVRAVLDRLPAVDPAAFTGRAVQDSVNRVNDFRRDVVADGHRYRVIIAPMM